MFHLCKQNLYSLFHSEWNGRMFYNQSSGFKAVVSLYVAQRVFKKKIQLCFYKHTSSCWSWDSSVLVRGYFSTEPVTLLDFPCQDLLAVVLPKAWTILHLSFVWTAAIICLCVVFTACLIPNMFGCDACAWKCIDKVRAAVLFLSQSQCGFCPQMRLFGHLFPVCVW